MVTTTGRYVPTTQRYVPTTQRYMPTTQRYVPTTQRFVPTVAFVQEQTPYIDAINNQQVFDNTTQAIVRPELRTVETSYLYNMHPTTQRPDAVVDSRIISQTNSPPLEQERYITRPPVRAEEQYKLPTNHPVQSHSNIVNNQGNSFLTNSPDQSQNVQAQHVYPTNQPMQKIDEQARTNIYPTYPPTQTPNIYTQPNKYPENNQIHNQNIYNSHNMYPTQPSIQNNNFQNQKITYPTNPPVREQNVLDQRIRTESLPTQNIPRVDSFNSRSQSMYPSTQSNSRIYAPTQSYPGFSQTIYPLYPSVNVPNNDASVRTTNDQMILSNRMNDGSFMTLPPELYLPPTPNTTTQRVPMYQTTIFGTMKPTNLQTQTNATAVTTLAPKRRPTTSRLTPDHNCGVTYGCFDDCRGGVCTFIVSWTPEGDATKFDIRTKPSTDGPHWAAIGFSDDQMMVSIVSNIFFSKILEST